jgi:cytochrome P450
MSRELVAYLGGAMIDAGSDTTSALLQTLVLAMVAFPEAQKKAQVRSLLLWVPSFNMQGCFVD